LINVGGDLRVFGGTDDSPFRIGIQHPERDTELAGRLRVMAGAVATSGDYQQFSVIGGRRYSHILDPRTGTPVSWSPSVTVLAPDAMTADALATGLSVLGAEKGVAVAAGLDGVECLFIRPGPSGELEAVMSPGLRDRFQVTPDSRIVLPPPSAD